MIHFVDLMVFGVCKLELLLLLVVNVGFSFEYDFRAVASFHGRSGGTGAFFDNLFRNNVGFLQGLAVSRGYFRPCRNTGVEDKVKWR